MAPYSSTFAWKIPWTEEPGRLQSRWSLRIGPDWATSLSLFTFMHWRRKWKPTPVFLLRESQGQGAWWAAVYGVAQSRTRLKRCSSSSSSTKAALPASLQNSREKKTTLNMQSDVKSKRTIHYIFPYQSTTLLNSKSPKTQRNNTTGYVSFESRCSSTKKENTPSHLPWLFIPENSKERLLI